MAMLTDKTDDFLASVRESSGFRSLRHGNEFLATRLRPVEASMFVDEAEKIRTGMEQLKARLGSLRQGYLDFDTGMSDSDRDEVDAENGRLIKGFSGRIDVLKEAEHGHPTMKAHRLGIAVSLVEELQVVDEMAREFRGARIRRALETKSRGAPAASRQKLEDLRPVEPSQAPPPTQIQNPQMLQALENENQTMYHELVQTLDEVQSAEKEMMKIAALNHMLASQVLEQSKGIEQLYDNAVGTVTSVERGNEHLRDLQRKGMGIQLKIALFLVFAAISLVTLEYFI